MRVFKFLPLAVLGLLVAASGAFGQTTTPPATPPALSDLGFSSFSITASVVGLKSSQQTIPVTDLTQALALNAKFSLRADQFIGPAVTSSSGSSTPSTLQAYFGGFKVFAPAIAKSTPLGALQFYGTAGAGVNRYADASGNMVNALAFYAGGGANVNPVSLGNLSVNVFEAKWMRLPGFQNSALALQTGLKLSF